MNKKSNVKRVLVNRDILTLLQALGNVEKEYLSYADTNANADDRKDQINQLERVFAYELYHQWAMIKEKNLFLNGEIGKIWTDDTWYPDLVLHGGQDDANNNRVVVEIKRECMVNGKPEAILNDLEKLSYFLDTVDKSSQEMKFRNYENAVFILLKGKLSDISKALNHKNTSNKKLNNKIICITYNERKDIEISSLEDLKK
jgi:hypothetical protein